MKKLKVLFLTNIPSPYRVDFFNELGKFCDLTVTFEGRTATDRNKKWKSDTFKEFKGYFLKGIRTGSDHFLCLEIIKVLKEKWDAIIVGVYSTPTSMLAIEYMRLHHINFYLNSDGGFVKQDNKIKYMIKKHFISSAQYWLSSSDVTTNYLVHYGAIREKCFKYPFTSIKQEDIDEALSVDSKGKDYLRNKLDIEEKYVVLSVGRFSYEQEYGKGNDTLLRCAEELDKNIGIYIVGDEPTEAFVRWKEDRHLKNIHYVGFKTKQELMDYYAAADIFVLMTKADVRGLVINEAMMFGLPIITTDMCIAGGELVTNDVNGFIIPVGDNNKLKEKIELLISDKDKIGKFGKTSREIILRNSVENMTKTRLSLWEVRNYIRSLYKRILNIEYKNCCLYVGQMIYRKGIDILLEVAKSFDGNTGFVLVGGAPTEDYLRTTNDNKLTNVKFIDFLGKQDINMYYKAADIFVFPTREDVWGLVVNEAMSFGLPIITTMNCGAGLELIEPGKNGYLINTGSVDLLIRFINLTICDSYFKEHAIVLNQQKIRNYTIEKMALNHIKIIEKCNRSTIK